MHNTRNKNKNKIHNRSKDLNSTLHNYSLISNNQKDTISSNNLGALRDQNLSSTPRSPLISDQQSSTRIWMRLSEKIDKQYELISELKQSMVDCKESIVREFELKLVSLGSEIADVKQKMCDIEKMAADLNSFKVEVDQFKQNFETIKTTSLEHENMKKTIEQLKIKIQKQEYSTVASDIRINGVPYNSNENLLNIFQSICHVINIPVPSIKSIFRLQNQNNKFNNHSPDAVIIVQMQSPYDKNFFLKTLALFRKSNKNFVFSLRHIGFDSDTKFFVNENLTQECYKILQTALRLKRQNHLCSAFTIRGNIFVKRNVNAKAILVDEISQLSDLNELFRESESNNTNMEILGDHQHSI